MSALPLNADSIDGTLQSLENALERVQRSQDSIVRLPGAELDLLRHVEVARDFMTTLVRNPGQRGSLQEIFGGDCARISRVRAVLETLKLSEMNSADQRLPLCLKACDSVEQVLKDLGLDSALRQAQERERESLAARLAQEAGRELGKDFIGEAKAPELLEDRSSLAENSPDQGAGWDFSTKVLIAGAAAVSQRQQRSEEGSAVAQHWGFRIGTALVDALEGASEALSSGYAASAPPEAPSTSELDELRVELLEAAELGEAEYRVGDIVGGIVGQMDHLAYVELELGSRQARTSPTPFEGDRRDIRLRDERHLLTFHRGQQAPTLVVRVREARKMQAMLRGDPLIGEGSLPLEELGDAVQHAEVRLFKGAKEAGRVKLSYTLLGPWSSETAAAAQEEKLSEFVTPPSSPR